MKLKQWPNDDVSYLQAIRQLAKFLGLYNGHPHDLDGFEDYAEARAIYNKLVKEIQEKNKLWSMEEFWKWCYITAVKQLDIYEEELSLRPQ